ncbi:ATP-binding protein [Paradonghicola geojensis]|nr:ATP-binding protein [Marivivens geojensis]
MIFNTTIKKLLARIAAFLFLVCLAAKAVANSDQIQVRHAVGDFSIEEVVKSSASSFSNFSLGENLGFQTEPVWFRLDVSKETAVTDQHLIITPVHIDSITVWAGGADGYEQILNAGDQSTSPLSMIPDGYTVRVTDDQFNEPIYIRLASHNVIHPFFELVGVNEVRKMASTSVFLFSITIAITVLYFAWAVSAAIHSPQALIFVFILRLVLFVFTFSIHSGLWRFLVGGEELPPQDMLHNVSGLAYITIAQLFDLALLRTLYTKKAIKAFLAIILISTFAKVGLFISGEVSLALTINNTSALLTLVAGGFMVLLPRQSAEDNSKIQLSRTAVGAYFALQAFPLIVLVILTYLGNSNYLRVFALMFINYALVPGGFIAYAMFRQQQRVFRSKTELELYAKHLAELSRLEQNKRVEMKRLLETLAHEIKTPLATLQMAEAVGRIDQKLLHRATSSIGAALAQMSKAERIERGSFALDKEELALCSLIDKVVANLGSTAKVQCAETVIQADWNALYIVLTNLIGNAENYKAPNTQVFVQVEQNDERVTILIGNALSRPIREPDRLFEKYFRDRTTAKEPGTGLGLYLSKSLVEAFGAKIKIVSSQAQFLVQLTFEKRV